ncbi:MAG: hypothetical protein A2355_12820 [Spirochaetes bacterium RIFOXYB1_FULL_32_8]|nr:MAG: hypothetical protein A2Y30_08425 [Spirochaetes bacterium GWE1_32_154]OHD51413.1 MAG: hypothetical protein A2Y29_14810 [Spirochaetes bacterium GWE2_31_10]OHD73803.1 MAG: hypothetical protein A2355_12820 [Spirochaetes bacterium RIFOXYB1_FULL_32_8]HBI36085.1 hypothetical protein [Spirochaetia bacterium]
MKSFIITFILVISLMTLAASMTGFTSLKNLKSERIEKNGDIVTLVSNGIYKGNPLYFTTAAIGFDTVRLFISLPILIFAFIFYLRGSLKAGMILAGILFNYFYQYFEFVMAFTYNRMFLLYTLNFSLSFITGSMLLISISNALIKSKKFQERFPVKTIAVFLITGGFLLLLKCLGETGNSLIGGVQPHTMIGQHTLWDQAMDIGIIFPFCLITGILLLKRVFFSYLMSISGLIFFANLTMSVIIGEIISSRFTGILNIPGIIVFSILEMLSIIFILRVIGVGKSSDFVLLK